jgi:phosphopantetheine adenylyltransferase
MTKWNNQAPTVQLLGRYQPWHPGHTELFKRAHAKTGQVMIMVRDTGGSDEKNPFDYAFVKERIIKDLEAEGFKFNRDFLVNLVPNIVNITYGRDVGYTIDKEDFDKEILKISATQIRKEMGL